MRITLLDASTLLFHVIRGVEHPEVGYGDAERPLGKLRGELNRSVSLDKSAIESAIWSCTMMKEAGSFYHPDGLTLEQVIKKLTPKGERFNPLYGVWERDKEKSE